MDSKEFDNIFRHNQDGFDKRPTNTAWDRLEKQLDQVEVQKAPKYRSLVRKYGAVAAVCLLFLLPATAWWAISQMKSSSKPMIQLTNKKPPQRHYRGEGNSPKFQPAIQHSTDNNSRTNNRYEESIVEKENPKETVNIKEPLPNANKELVVPKTQKEKLISTKQIDKENKQRIPLKEEKISKAPKIEKEAIPFQPKETILIEQKELAKETEKIDSPKEEIKEKLEISKEETRLIEIKEIEKSETPIAQWDNSTYSNAYIPAMPKYYWMMGEWKDQKKSDYWSWETLSDGHVQGIEYSIGKNDTTVLQICDIKETALGVSLAQNDFRGKEESFVQYYKDMKSKKLIFVEASGNKYFKIEQGDNKQMWIKESNHKKRVLEKEQ